MGRFVGVLWHIYAGLGGGGEVAGGLNGWGGIYFVRSGISHGVNGCVFITQFFLPIDIQHNSFRVEAPILLVQRRKLRGHEPTRLVSSAGFQLVF